jgi:ankyrin repeat protein
MECAVIALRELAAATELQRSLTSMMERARQDIKAATEVERVIDSRDRLGRTAAYLAAEAGHHGILLMLHRHGADLKVANADGVSPLHMACRRGHIECVRFLLSLDVRQLVEAEDNGGETPLYSACAAGHSAVVGLLLRRAADLDVNRPTTTGLTPLLAAVARGNLPCVQLITESEARGRKRIDFSRARDSDGATPFYLACSCGDLEMVRWLAKRGAPSLLQRPATDGTTPFAVAAFHGHLDTMRYLSGAGVDAETANRDGNTPLHLACAEGQLSAVQYLVEELDASLYSRNAAGVDAFQVAVDADAHQVVSFLAGLAVPPAVALQRTRLLQHRLNPPRNGESGKSAAATVAAATTDEGCEAEEEAGEGHGEEGRGRTSGGGAAAIGAPRDLLGFAGAALHQAAAADQGPSDAELHRALLDIEWRHVQSAERVRRLSVAEACQRLKQDQPDWRRLRGLRARVAAAQPVARDAAMRKLVRSLELQEQHPSAMWAAPSHVFGEGMSTAAGLSMPPPCTSRTKVAAPAGAKSEWEREVSREASDTNPSHPSVAHDTVQPQSAMAAAEAHWARHVQSKSRHRGCAKFRNTKPGRAASVGRPSPHDDSGDGEMVTLPPSGEDGAPPLSPGATEAQNQKVHMHGRKGRRNATTAEEFNEDWLGDSREEHGDGDGERGSGPAQVEVAEETVTTRSSAVHHETAGWENAPRESRSEFVRRVHAKRVGSRALTLNNSVDVADLVSSAITANQQTPATRRRKPMIELMRRRSRLCSTPTRAN